MLNSKYTTGVTDRRFHVHCEHRAIVYQTACHMYLNHSRGWKTYTNYEKWFSYCFYNISIVYSFCTFTESIVVFIVCHLSYTDNSNWFIVYLFKRKKRKLTTKI